MNPDKPDAAGFVSSVSAVRLAARYLLTPRDTAHEPDSRWHRAGRWFVFWGAVFGFVYVFVYWLTWSVFGEYMQIRLVPCVCLLMVDQLWLGHRLSAGCVALRNHETDTRDPLGVPPHHRTTMLILILVMLKLALLIYIPSGRHFVFPSISWRSSLGQTLPEPVYFPLFLMPMWGRWAMMLSLTMGRVVPTASRRLTTMVEGARLRGPLFWGIFLMLVTLVLACPQAKYVPHGIVVVMATLLMAYSLAFAIIRIERGQSEAGLNATGALAEIAFLMAYLPAARAIYSY